MKRMQTILESIQVLFHIILTVDIYQVPSQCSGLHPSSVIVPVIASWGCHVFKNGQPDLLELSLFRSSAYMSKGIGSVTQAFAHLVF